MNRTSSIIATLSLSKIQTYEPELSSWCIIWTCHFLLKSHSGLLFQDVVLEARHSEFFKPWSQSNLLASKSLLSSLCPPLQPLKLHGSCWLSPDFRGFLVSSLAILQQVPPPPECRSFLYSFMSWAVDLPSSNNYAGLEGKNKDFYILSCLFWLKKNHDH